MGFGALSETAELLERFRSGPEWIAAAIAEVTPAELDWVPAPGKWTIRKIVCHMADTELVAGDRIRRLLAEDNPPLIPFNQDAWADKLDYGRRDVISALDLFRRMRAGNADLLADLPEEAWSRSGIHSERGRVTLLDTVRIHARHAQTHARQIENIRQAHAGTAAE